MPAHCDTSISPHLLDAVPAGRWGVAVSGGADSVALLSLVVAHSRIEPVVIHLDHQTRHGQSTEDARFVEQLAEAWGVPCASSQLADVELHAGIQPDRNAMARYRTARYAWFNRVARERNLAGVLVAHHADDQAETVLLRLLRGGSIAGLTGMRPQVTTMETLTVRRPLLGVSAAALRDYLREQDIAWREDPTNTSPDYQRSLARRLLTHRPALREALLDLSQAARQWRDWLDAHVPVLGEQFRIETLRDLAPTFQIESARRWLVQRCGSPDDVTADAAQRLIAMATDAATPAKVSFPGPITVRRRSGQIYVDRTTA